MNKVKFVQDHYFAVLFCKNRNCGFGVTVLVTGRLKPSTFNFLSVVLCYYFEIICGGRYNRTEMNGLLGNDEFCYVEIQLPVNEY